ncbi:MAG: DUF4391 domain-containing protein [Vampirovibrionia bacterium]
MKSWINFPDRCRNDSVITKSKIYDQAKVNSRLKEAFIEQVEKIIWRYKLSSSKLNIDSVDDLHEIQVIELQLKKEDLNAGVLKVIDEAILSPIIFLLNFQGHFRYFLAYKTLSQSKKEAILKSSYLNSEWVSVETTEKLTLSAELNMEALYFWLIKLFIPYALKETNLESYVQIYEKILKLEREIHKLKSRLSKEKQFKKKVNINIELQEKEKELKSLTNG